jgi:hypothetical protein
MAIKIEWLNVELKDEVEIMPFNLHKAEGSFLSVGIWSILDEII